MSSEINKHFCITFKSNPMKRNTIYQLVGVLAVFFMYACNSNLDLDKTLNFSKLTVQEQKQQLEESAIEFVDVMDGIQDEAAFEPAMNFVNKAGGTAASPVKQLNLDLKNRSTRILKNFDRQLRVAYADSTIAWGLYEWNSAKGVFVKTADYTDKIVYKYPSTENGTSNNVIVTIVYTESDVLAPESDQYYPSSMTYEMKVDGKVVMSADFTGTYKDDGTPVKVKQSLEIGEYSWVAQITNTTDEASESYEFKHAATTLVKMEASAAGEITAENLNSDDPTATITKGAVYFQLMDVAILGGMKDFQGFREEMIALDNSETANDQDRIDILNKYLICYGYYVSDNTKFADVEFYLKTTQEEYYDEFLQQWVTSTSTDVVPRFVLSDGSKVDIENYVQTGFEDLTTRLEEYQTETTN